MSKGCIGKLELASSQVLHVSCHCYELKLILFVQDLLELIVHTRLLAALI